MKLIDLHCDTISQMTFYNRTSSLQSSNNDVDIEKLKKSNSLLQVFAMFVNQEECEDSLDSCLNMLDKFNLELEKNTQDISLIKNYEDIIANQNSNKISALLSVEEGAVIKGKIYNLRNLYRLGVRLMTLTWNYPNEIGYPHCKEEYTDKGLTEFGQEVVREMNKIGMIIDVSHLSDGGFYDVAKLSQKPFVASHSNSRAIKNHTRNMTDEMIKLLADKGGVMGLNFCNYFLGNNEHGSLEDMVKHIKHIRNVGGIEVIALGTDFDGIDLKPEINDIGEMDKLIYALQKEGFKENEIENIFFKNALRIFKEVLQ